MSFYSEVMSVCELICYFSVTLTYESIISVLYLFILTIISILLSFIDYFLLIKFISSNKLYHPQLT